MSRPAVSLSLGMIGAAFAVGIGYMDPGNWATDLDATRYGDALLWAVLASGIAAALLQILIVRYTTASGNDLVAAVAQRWPVASRWLWFVYALAILATELAEFVGLVIGIQLLTHLVLAAAVVLAAFACCALLAVSATSARRVEKLAVLVTGFVAIVYGIDLAHFQPALQPLITASFTPTLPGSGALLAVVGIVGATIMPHNLFLHSGLTLQRIKAAPRSTHPAIQRIAIRSTVVALLLATAINMAILVVGGETHSTSVTSAFAALVPVAGQLSALLFGLALIVTALAASTTATYAGDIICCEGAPISLSRLQRRLAAIVPGTALLLLGFSPNLMLIASQIVLGLALPAVVIPLLVLVFEAPLRRSSLGLALVASSSIVVVGAIVCDGLLLTSMLAHI